MYVYTIKILQNFDPVQSQERLFQKKKRIYLFLFQNCSMTI